MSNKKYIMSDYSFEKGKKVYPKRPEIELTKDDFFEGIDDPRNAEYSVNSIKLYCTSNHYDVIDKDVAKTCLDLSKDYLRFSFVSVLSDDLKADKDLMLYAASQNGLNYIYMTDECKNDRDIALTAVSSYNPTKECGDEWIRNDVLQKTRLRYPVLNPSATDRDVVFRYVPEDLRNDKDFALKAVQCDSLAYKFVPDTLKSDMDILSTVLADKNCNIVDDIPDEYFMDEQKFTIIEDSAEDSIKEKIHSRRDYLNAVHKSQTGEDLTDKEALAFIEKEGAYEFFNPSNNFNLNNLGKDVIVSLVSDYSPAYADILESDNEFKFDKDVFLTALNDDPNYYKYINMDLGSHVPQSYKDIYSGLKDFRCDKDVAKALFEKLNSNPDRYKSIHSSHTFKNASPFDEEYTNTIVSRFTDDLKGDKEIMALVKSYCPAAFDAYAIGDAKKDLSDNKSNKLADQLMAKVQKNAANAKDNSGKQAEKKGPGEG